MTIYVDELPKCCSDCPCFYEDGISISCQASDKWLDLSIEKNFNRGKQIHKDCPLQTIAEHNKQVRKQIVQEIRQQLKEVEKFHPEDDFELDYDYYIKEDVDEVLDKVEKSCKN